MNDLALYTDVSSLERQCTQWFSLKFDPDFWELFSVQIRDPRYQNRLVSQIQRMLTLAQEQRINPVLSIQLNQGQLCYHLRKPRGLVWGDHQFDFAQDEKTSWVVFLENGQPCWVLENSRTHQSSLVHSGTVLAVIEHPWWVMQLNCLGDTLFCEVVCTHKEYPPGAFMVIGSQVGPRFAKIGDLSIIQKKDLVYVGVHTDDTHVLMWNVQELMRARRIGLIYPHKNGFVFLVRASEEAPDELFFYDRHEILSLERTLYFVGLGVIEQTTTTSVLWGRRTFDDKEPVSAQILKDGEVIWEGKNLVGWEEGWFGKHRFYWAIGQETDGRCSLLVNGEVLSSYEVNLGEIWAIKPEGREELLICVKGTQEIVTLA